MSTAAGDTPLEQERYERLNCYTERSASNIYVKENISLRWSEISE